MSFFGALDSWFLLVCYEIDVVIAMLLRFGERPFKSFMVFIDMTRKDRIKRRDQN